MGLAKVRGSARRLRQVPRRKHRTSRRPSLCASARPDRCGCDSLSRGLAWADVRIVTVRADYEFDRSRWAAGPRKALQVIYVSAIAECTAVVANGCAEALSDSPDAWDGPLMQELMIGYSFRTLAGLDGLKRKYRMVRMQCRTLEAGVRLNARVELEAW